MVKLKVEETSGVDHPAHLEEGWIVMKAADQRTKMARASKGFEMDEEETEKADKMPAFIQAKIDAREEKEDDEAEMDKADDEEEVDFEAMFAKMKEERDMFKGKYEAYEKQYGKMEEDEESMEKSMPAPVRELLTKARNEASAARAELRKEVENRKDREYVAKAAAWTALSLDANDIGVDLRKMAEIDGDLTKKIMSALTSANAQADAANIFAELGTSNRPDSGDAYGRMTKMAKSAVDSGEHKTIEQAISALVVTHPDLYDAYRQENR